MDIPNPVFVGFFPKITLPAPDELKSASVEQIASVSDCLSSGPPGWVNHWQHNLFGFYDTEAIALSVVDEGYHRVDLFAYRVFPFCVLDDTLAYFLLQVVAGDVPDDYEFLGYDIVTKSSSDFFECSPLSCNFAAQDYPVNRWCLITNLEDAFRAIQEISQLGIYEPGPYYLFEVHLKIT